MNKYKNFLWGAAIIFFYGCAASTTNLSPVHHKDKPRIQTFKVPSLDNIKLKTFSVFPVSRLKTEPLLKDDMRAMNIILDRMEGKVPQLVSGTLGIEGLTPRAEYVAKVKAAKALEKGEKKSETK